MEAFIIGKIVRAGILSAPQSGTLVLEKIAVRVDRTFGQKIITTYVECRIFGKAAQYFADKLAPKVNVMIEGLIEVEKNPQGAPYPTLIISEVQILPMALPNKIKVVGCGNVTKDAEVRTIKQGESNVLNTAIAVNRKVGQIDKASFFEIAYFVQTRTDGINGASNIAPYIRPGVMIEVTGILDLDKYEGQNGERQKVVITVDHIKLHRAKGDSQRNAKPKPSPVSMSDNNMPEIDINEDEIPF